MTWTETGAEWRREQSLRYLAGITAAGRHIAALKAELDTSRELVRGISYDELAVSSSPTADAIPDAVARVVDAGDTLTAEIAAYCQAVEDCRKALDEMGGRDADLLRLRYLAGKTLTEIGGMDEWRHSKQYMSLLHREALVRFADYIPAPMREPRPPAI